jgi:Tfp pilus assembly PilM family ATPase
MRLSLRGIRKHASPIGLDLGTTAVRAVQVEHRDRGWSVAHLSRCAIEGQGDPAAVREAAARCLRQGNFVGRKVCAALPGQNIEYHMLELPEKVAEGNSHTQQLIVENEVRRLMTQGDAAVEIRHWTLPRSSASAAPSAIGAAAPRELVMGLVDLCANADATCSCVDLSAWALARFGTAMHAWGDNEVGGVLDLGAAQARLVLSVRGVPVLVRAVGEGGTAWTHKLAETLQISDKAAEIQKREHGLAFHDGAQAPAGSDSELASLVFGALRTDISKLATQVKRSYDFVISCYPGAPIGTLLLTGAGARLSNLHAHLATMLGIRVRRPSDAAGPDDRGDRPPALPGRETLEEYAEALGLALSEGADGRN